MVREGAGGQRALGLLARDFYLRIESRRFNSIATYQDPSLREFFRSDQAWSDYYAHLVQKLEENYFEAVRPTRVEVTSIEFEVPEESPPAPGAGPSGGAAEPPPPSALVTVRFVGENGRPLRWWTTEMTRVDRWTRLDDRWWIIPGKL